MPPNETGNPVRRREDGRFFTGAGRYIDMPATPERVWRAQHARGKS